jgi:hypothetical protein
MKTLNERNITALLAVALTMTLTACGGGSSDSTPADNCPGIDNPSQLDTDGDGDGDACDSDDDNDGYSDQVEASEGTNPLDANSRPLDTDNDGNPNSTDLDDDNDGFNDSDDPAPLDASIPGDFSTPEAILNNPIMRTALAQIRDQGIDLRTEQGLNPPDLTGYYIRADDGGVFTATSNGTDIGRGLVGGESRLTAQSNNFIDRAGVSFTSAQPISFGLSKGSIIRGEGNNFTIYSRGKGTCTEANSDFDTFSVGIASSTLDPASGDLLLTTSISVTVDTEGALTSTCANRIVANNETEGNWSVVTYDRNRHVNVNELQYMCVDENVGYAPTETWKDSSGASCSCTKSYQVSCQ